MRPKKIVVIRHAEKPLDDNDQRLTSLGMARARYIAEYIPKNFGVPDIIFATAVTEKSARPALTVLPLFEKTDCRTFLDLSIDNDAAEHLGHHLIHGDGIHPHCGMKYMDSTVLVCWHHGKIPELFRGLGVEKEQYPNPWPEDDFSSVYVVSFSDNMPVVSRFQMQF